MDAENPMPTLLAGTLHRPSHASIEVIPGYTHRLNLLRAWSIPAAHTLLDIGCGQGESTLTLALTARQVTGLDNAPADYGSPYTLGESQAHILASPLGARIAFVRADPLEFLRGAPERPADAVVFCHSLWYFASGALVRDTLAAVARAGVPRIYLAEWAGSAGHPGQEAHVLATEAQRALHGASREGGGSREQNVRSGVAAEELWETARTEGWRIARKGVLEVPEGMMDAQWETQYVLSKVFDERVRAEGLDGDLEREILSYRERVRGAVEEVKRGGANPIPCMDVVWAVLERE